MKNETINTIVGDTMTEVTISNPDVTFTQHSNITSITTPIQKPFAVISKDGEITSFDKELCEQGAKAFLEGTESPLNITCFIVDALIKKINQMIEPMNETDIKSLLKDFSIEPTIIKD